MFDRESLTSGVQNLSLVLLSFLHTEILQADVEAKSVSISCVAEALELVTRSCQADEGPWSRMQAAKVAGDSVFLDFFTDKRWVDSQNGKFLSPVLFFPKTSNADTSTTFPSFYIS